MRRRIEGETEKETPPPPPHKKKRFIKWWDRWDNVMAMMCPALNGSIHRSLQQIWHSVHCLWLTLVTHAVYLWCGGGGGCWVWELAIWHTKTLSLPSPYRHRHQFSWQFTSIWRQCEQCNVRALLCMTAYFGQWSSFKVEHVRSTLQWSLKPEKARYLTLQFSSEWFGASKWRRRKIVKACSLTVSLLHIF